MVVTIAEEDEEDTMREGSIGGGGRGTGENRRAVDKSRKRYIQSRRTSRSLN